MIWLNKPVLWHSSRVNGYNFKIMTPYEATLARNYWLSWYTCDWAYGQTTIAFFCIAIAICLLGNLLFLWRSRRTPSSLPRPSVSGTPTSTPTVLDRSTALVRYGNARQFHVGAGVLGEWYSPPLSSILGVLGLFIFVMALMLGKRPYYWPSRNLGHSMPIATRTGWISIAIMPFMIAFSTKVNYVALLTGTSHEKLQVFHRWSAAFMYITSLVHTFPFIYKSIQWGQMTANWYTSPWYWTGVAALVPQTYLVFGSWSIFRAGHYELFKKLHFVASGIFMVALFIHVGFRLTSWDYFWATLAVWGSAWLIRVMRTFYNSGTSLSAEVSALPGVALLQVSIAAPARLAWGPGQHVFLRFLDLGLHAFSSHPFTIASLPPASAAGTRTMHIVMRVHDGITAALARRIAGRASVRLLVWVDGPYGGVPAALKAYDTVLLLAGGSGASLVAPLLADFAAQPDSTAQRVQVVFALRTKAEYGWLEDGVRAAQQAHGARLTAHVHITGVHDEHAAHASAANSEDDEKQSATSTVFAEGRPDLRALVRDECAGAVGRVAIVACGPPSFLYDIRKAVAERQLALARGGSNGGARDVFLHTESYHW